jgi:hypothetical protein
MKGYEVGVAAVQENKNRFIKSEAVEKSQSIESILDHLVKVASTGLDEAKTRSLVEGLDDIRYRVGYLMGVIHGL